MISNAKELFGFMDTLLKPQGYLRKKDTYYLVTSECICFFCIIKSDFGGYYEDLMGCFVKGVYDGKDEFPKYYKNNLKYVLNYFVDSNLVKEVFDLENKTYVANEREFLIKELIEMYVIPFLKDISTKEGIRAAIHKYKELKYYMDYDLRSALGISIEDQH